MKKEEIFPYLNTLEQKLSTRDIVRRPLNDILNYPLTSGQCLYILDYSNKTVRYQRGVEELLGYTPKEFTFDLVTSFFHPDDYDMVSRLMKAILSFATENQSKDIAFTLTYRVRKKDGSYLKVIRQSSSFDLDNNGRIISNLSMLSDISFLSPFTKVEWKFEAPGLDAEKFRKQVTKEYKGFFSDKEMEVIKSLNEGLSSKEIAEKLNLSKHTIDTHRRNMLYKAQCKNTVELMNFCKHNGLI
jgi:DNA-binding CsgD family transcriptional regulator